MEQPGKLAAEDRLLDISQVLELIPIGKSTLWQHVKSGKFPKPIHIGSRAFWCLSDIRSLISQNQNKENF